MTGFLLVYQKRRLSKLAHSYLNEPANTINQNLAERKEIVY